MNKAHTLRISLLATLLAAAPLVLADGDGDGAAAAPAAAAAEHSMTGCLAAGATDGTFRLTDLAMADGPAEVEIALASVDLAPHVGHKVEITGSTVMGADPAAHIMSVSAVKHLAPTCP